MKLLIDECLSPDLVAVALAKGHGESSHVVWLGKAGWKDWELRALSLPVTGPLSQGIVWTFVGRKIGLA